MAGKPAAASRRNKLVTRILVALTLFGLLACVVSVGVAVWLIARGDAGKVKEGSFLRVALSGPIPDAPAQGGLFLDPEDVPPVATEVAEAIRAAAADERIAGLYLRLDTPAIGWGNLQELRGAIADLQAAGKPCVVYAEAYTTPDYYLASSCDTVLIAPGGVVLVAGLSANLMYYGDAFAKIGVDPEFEHVGEFKTGPEPYELNAPSPEALLAYNEMLDSLYNQLVAGVAASRELPEEQVREFIDHPSLTPKVAVERKLVDGAVFPDAIREHLRKAGEADFVATLVAASDAMPAPADEDEEKDDELFTSLAEYLKSVRADHDDQAAQVAVIHAEGNILSGKGGGGLFSDAALTDGAFREWMEEARENDDVKAVVVRVNSPGGSGLASDMMWREVEITKAAGKPVVVSMANYAASGGYYISANADWVVAQPATLTGSIGVFGGKFNLDGTFDKLGLQTYHLDRGQNASLFAMDAPFSEEGRLIYRAFLEDFYVRFVTKVAEGRSKTYEEAHSVAKGRVWTGEQALGFGLVDQLGGLHDATAKAAELSDLTEYGIVRLPRQKAFLDVLLEDLGSASQPTLTVELPIAGDALRDLTLLERALEDGVAALMPAFEVK